MLPQFENLTKPSLGIQVMGLNETLRAVLLTDLPFISIPSLPMLSGKLLSK